jgi:23S rRNA (adenine2503-C2)-methyltransferase
MPEVRPESAATALGLSHDAFVRGWKDGGLGKAERATHLYKAFFREGTVGLHAAGATALELQSFPAPAAPTGVLRSDSPEGEVIKFLLDVPGAPSLRAAPATTPATTPALALALAQPAKAAPLQTESVVIPMKRRHETTFTLCVSSQVGCAMGCTFCETAQMGLIRSLTPAEIVGQWWAATHHLGAQIRNIVFMGMGEPLDNLDSVLGAIEVLTDNRGPAIGMSRITVSTVGKLDGLAKLREAVQRPGWKQLNLAVSVNAPNDDVRSAIMPINRGMPLGELIPMLETWPRRKSGAICVEYVLIPGVNDAPEHAAELAARFKGVRCCVNVIPYNPRRNSPWPAPQEEDVSRFLADLEAAGQFCKRRRTKGRDTMAACGQLGNEQIRGRKLVGGAL